MEMKDKKIRFASLLRITRLPWVILILTMACCVLQTVLSLYLPNISSKLLAGEFTDENLKTMIWVLAINAFVLAGRQFLMELSRSRITLAFRKSVFGKLLRLKPVYYDRVPSDSMISRATLDTTMLSDFLVGFFCYLPSLLITFAGSLSVIYTYDWRLLLLELVVLPLIFLVTWLHGRVQFKWYAKMQGKLAELSAYLAGRLANYPLIKLFVMEENEFCRGAEAIDGLYRTQKQYGFRLCGVLFLVNMESAIQSVAVVVGGAWFISKGIITLQQWIAFYAYAGGIIGSVQQFLDYWERYKQMTGSAKRITELSAEPEEGKGGSEEAPKELRTITLKHVTFSYEADHPVLKDASCIFPAGKKIAVFGKSGAGKTTLLNLLERLYAPEEGHILYGDTDIETYSYDSWRGKLGYIFQNPTLFSGTIRENMLYGVKENVSDDKLRAALQKVSLLDYVDGTEKGLDTEVGEGGSRLSGGQRQRLAIAGIFLKNPRIILLDEFTSALDPEVRKAVADAIDELAKGRTLIMITHDDADGLNADMSLYLEDGKFSVLRGEEAAHE